MQLYTKLMCQLCATICNNTTLWNNAKLCSIYAQLCNNVNNTPTLQNSKMISFIILWYFANVLHAWSSCLLICKCSFSYHQHDSTIAAVTNAMQVFNLKSPPYASTVFLELHEINSAYFVQIRYRNDSRHDPYILIHPGKNVVLKQKNNCLSKAVFYLFPLCINLFVLFVFTSVISFICRYNFTYTFLPLYM